MSLFSKQYGDPLYLKSCEELSGYDFPADNWKGATLLLIIEQGVILIKRSSSMPTHANQWGLFGGKRAAGEIDPLDVAYREFSEESSLTTQDLSFVSYLPPVYTTANQIIISCAAKLEMNFTDFSRTVQSNGEWDFGLWVSMKDLKNEKNWSYGNRYGAQTSSQILFYELNKNNVKFFGSDRGREKLPIFWGATARMIWNYLQLER